MEKYPRRAIAFLPVCAVEGRNREILLWPDCLFKFFLIFP